MLSLEESLKILKRTNALIEGHFILSSGLHSPKYVQCAQLMSIPNEAIKICQSLADKIKSEFTDFDIILSPAMGGIIVGYELGKLLNKRTIFSAFPPYLSSSLMPLVSKELKLYAKCSSSPWTKEENNVLCSSKSRKTFAGEKHALEMSPMISFRRGNTSK